MGLIGRLIGLMIRYRGLVLMLWSAALVYVARMDRGVLDWSIIEPSSLTSASTTAGPNTPEIERITAHALDGGESTRQRLSFATTTSRTASNRKLNEQMAKLSETFDKLGPSDRTKVPYSMDPPIPAWHERWLARAGSSSVACATRGWSLRDSRPKLFDLFLLNNELDPLEIRLNELNSVVDKFVIVESLRTFTNLPKPSLFEDKVKSEPRFTKFLPKIVHVKLEELKGETNMEREAYQRNQLTSKGLEAAGVRDGDLVVLGDLDEIPRASTLNWMKTCTGWERKKSGEPTCLSLRLFYYSYEYRWQNSDWRFPHVVTYPSSLTGQQIRDFDCGLDLPFLNAGWHCSWCFPELDQFREKLEAYRHREDHQSVDKFKDSLYILDSIVGGLDLTDRPFQKYDNLRAAAEGAEDFMDMPSWLATERPQHLSYVWDRMPWAVEKGWKLPSRGER